MSKLNEEKREVLAYIDAILTMIEKSPTLNLSGLLDNVSLGVSINPWDFLLEIISKKVTDEEMMEWLVKVMTELLPVIELGIKGVLLSNLKSLIDCNLDPRIPYWLRKSYKSPLWNGNVDKNGFIFNLKAIDYCNMLSISPLSQLGQQKYFGTKCYYTFNKGKLASTKYYSYKEAVKALEQYADEKDEFDETLTVENIIQKGEINNVYELARANDFNAFLWFVKNKARFIHNIHINDENIKSFQDNNQNPFSNNEYVNILHSLNAVIEIDRNRPISKLSQGVTITQGKYNIVSLCIKSQSKINEGENKFTDDNGLDYGSINVLTENACLEGASKTNTLKFVPVSSDYDSANWYVNSGTYFNFLLKEEKRVLRDYNTDFAICNIENITADEAVATETNVVPYGEYIRFTVLPAPFVHLPQMNFKLEENGKKTELSVIGEPPWRIKRILFNADGEADPSGKYSVVAYDFNESGYYYSLKRPYDDSTSPTRLVIDSKTGEYSLEGTDLSVLYECYPGLTVYDFNYHFVMGMQLFDPTVIASNLMEMITNLRVNGSINIGVGLDKTETAYQMRIAEIVKNVIEDSGYESSDCFYSFSNDKFNSMLEKAELKRSQGYPFENSASNVAIVNMDEAYSILSEFDDSASLQVNKDVLTRAITKATATITDEALPEDAYNLKLKIIQELIKGFTLTIVQTILTPKIVLLFEINKRMLGSDGTVLSFEEFIDSISTLLVSIVRQIADMILRELLRWAQIIILDLIEKLAAMLLTEKVEYYTRLMIRLLKACSFRIKRSKPLDSMLDNVDYADIDEVDRPQSNEC